MQRLMADIERLSTRRVQNAVDRSEATKWRRSVAGRAPFATKDPPRESQSRELTGDIATPSDVTADGRYRKMVHETRSERRRSLRTDEMAPNDTQVGTLSTAPFWGGAQNRPNTLIFLRGGRRFVLWAHAHAHSFLVFYSYYHSTKVVKQACPKPTLMSARQHSSPSTRRRRASLRARVSGMEKEFRI